MGEYQRVGNQIQAAIAHRLGKIAIQYQTLSVPAEEDFSVTLDVCILQNLLTTIVEQLKARRKDRRHDDLRIEIAKTRIWGLRQEMIDENTFEGAGKETGEVVLRRLRNALSHPLDLDIDDRFPTTGYTTTKVDPAAIHRFCFVNSPDVTMRGRPKTFDSAGDAKIGLTNAQRDGDMPEHVTPIPYGADKFCFGLVGKPFARIFKIYLTSEEIHALVIGLSNYLAEPIQKNSDTSTRAGLVA